MASQQCFNINLIFKETNTVRDLNGTELK